MKGARFVLMLAVLGFMEAIREPQIFLAVNPIYAVRFFIEHGIGGLQGSREEPAMVVQHVPGLLHLLDRRNADHLLARLRVPQLGELQGRAVTT